MKNQITRDYTKTNECRKLVSERKEEIFKLYNEGLRGIAIIKKLSLDVKKDCLMNAIKYEIKKETKVKKEKVESERGRRIRVNKEFKERILSIVKNMECKNGRLGVYDIIVKEGYKNSYKTFEPYYVRLMLKY